jgi:hypothetical protein
MLFAKSASCLLGIAIISLLIPAGPAHAGLITLGSQSLTDLLGPTPTADGSALFTTMNGTNMQAQVTSQVFTNGSGQYVYLYQINNTGTSGASSVELFTLWPFTGANDSTVAGSLSGPLPAAFLSIPSQDPKPRAFVKPLSSGPQISFYYTLDDDKAIDPGEHSVVMYVASPLSPDMIDGNVIDGSIGTGEVLGPLPEPATLALLSLGGVAVLLKRRRNRK